MIQFSHEEALSFVRKHNKQEDGHLGVWMTSLRPCEITEQIIHALENVKPDYSVAAYLDSGIVLQGTPFDSWGLAAEAMQQTSGQHARNFTTWMAKNFPTKIKPDPLHPAIICITLNGEFLCPALVGLFPDPDDLSAIATLPESQASRMAVALCTLSMSCIA